MFKEVLARLYYFREIKLLFFIVESALDLKLRNEPIKTPGRFLKCGAGEGWRSVGPIM